MKYIPNTISITPKHAGVTYRVQMTQWLHPEHDFGHLHLAIEDNEGNIIQTYSTSGGPPDRVGESFLEDQFKRLILEKPKRIEERSW